MMTPNMMTIISLIMFSTLILNLMTNKTSIMCMNLMLFALMMSMTISMKISLTPIPFIVFLTMIGGLMIIFLYLAATLWAKKETMILKLKTMILLTLLTPMIYLTSTKIPLLPNKINLFKHNMNKITIIMIILLTIMLVFIIEIYIKMNFPFRRKLKIWE